MDYLRRLYCNIGIRMSRLINFKMQEIMHLRGKVLLCVNSHCDDLSLQQLEEIREKAKKDGENESEEKLDENDENDPSLLIMSNIPNHN